MKAFLVNKSSLKLFTISLLSCLIVLGCKKKHEVNNPVPNVYVDIYIHINDPAFVNLNAVGGWVYVTGGNRGIIVYRKSMSEFMAYDRTCTYESNKSNAIVDVDQSNVMAIDSSCGSKFLLTDGTVAHPPATIPLKAYQTSFDGSVIHIYN